MPAPKRALTALAALAAAAALAGSTAPAASSAASQAPAQETTGSIAAPLRFALDPTYASWPGGQRQIWTIAGSNGHVGYTLPLTCEEGGVCVENGKFKLEVVSGATGLEDLDISFYASFSPVVSGGQYQTRLKGGEAGTIPDGSRFAIVTMFEGLNAQFKFTAWQPEPAVVEKTKPKPYPLPAAPGIHPSYGFDDTGQWRKKLKSRSHVVIALVDSGINPYHVAFRRPEYRIHPSNYIEGYPTSSAALGLTFGSSYAQSRNGDDPEVWSKVQNRTLYWIPGTNVIGAYSVQETWSRSAPPPPGFPRPRPIIDDLNHGTGVASASAGGALSRMLGRPYGSNPDALIVVIEGLGDEGVEWALNQPWIDFVSASWGDPLAIPYNDLVDGFAQHVPVAQEELASYTYRYSAPFVLRDGRTACFSAGNGLSRTGLAYDRYSSIRPTSGPSWVVTVGAISPRNEQDYGWHSVPVDVSSYGLHWPAAEPWSVSGEWEFGGTSNATPVTCGVFSKALLAVRQALGDAEEGIHTDDAGKRVPSIGPRIAGGAAADGVLTRLELQDAVFKTARNGRVNPSTYLYDPPVVPDTPLYFTMQGYGLANVESGRRAIDVLLGRAPLPARPEVDAWIAGIDAIRNSVWPPPTYP